jgi:hypothetical protein
MASTRTREAGVTRSSSPRWRTAALRREDARAAIEADRSQLIGVANQIGFCNQALVDLIQQLDGGFPPGSAEIESASTECAAADQAISSYNASTGR